LAKRLVLLLLLSRLELTLLLVNWLELLLLLVGAARLSARPGRGASTVKATGFGTGFFSAGACNAHRHLKI
jgi:hypothetical protein